MNKKGNVRLKTEDSVSFQKDLFISRSILVL